MVFGDLTAKMKNEQGRMKNGEVWSESVFEGRNYRRCGDAASGITGFGVPVLLGEGQEDI
jgi:hypothetical protein